MKIRLFSTILLCFLPLAATAQTADEIVKKAVDARGGIEKIKAVQSERITARLTSGQGLEAAVVLELKRPHKMHSEVTVEGQKIIRVYDGKSGGWSINPFAENKDVQPMSAEDLKEAPATVARSNSSFTRGILAWQGGTVGCLDEELLFSTLNRSLA